MSRTHDIGFSECPICGKRPYVHIFEPTVAMAYCKGHGFHKHKEVSVSEYERPSELLKKLAQRWNQMHYEQSRFLFNHNGNPFKEIEMIEHFKPMQKPLDLEAAKHGDRLYVEFKDDEPELIHVIEEVFSPDLFGYNRLGSRDCQFNVNRASYGKAWRLWAMEPTDEERAAAKWENAADAP